MINSLRELLQNRDRQSFATDAGTKMHAQLRHVVIDPAGDCGDAEIIQQIKSHADLIPFFTRASQTEVPVAGYLHGKFVSRRIDRLVINHDKKIVYIMDYKTDTDKGAYRGSYITQIGEYRELLREIYPDYTIRGFILWLHDWQLEEVN